MLVEGVAPRLPPLRGGTRRRASEAERQFRFAGRGLGLRSVFLEIAAGDCAVARGAAGHGERADAAGARDARGDARAPPLVPGP
ncbi:MAG: hypothetical protein ACT4P3_20245, partial [Betaproteobacteria bacterium]